MEQTNYLYKELREVAQREMRDDKQGKEKVYKRQKLKNQQGNPWAPK